MPLNDLCPLRHNLFFSSLYNPERYAVCALVLVGTSRKAMHI